MKSYPTYLRLMIGKPYSGKLNVRFDEGELEIRCGCDTVTLVNERARNSEEVHVLTSL